MISCCLSAVEDKENFVFIPVLHISSFEDLIGVNSTKSYLQISVFCTDNIQKCLVNS